MIAGVVRRCLGGCVGRIAFVIFSLIVLALYIHFNGPVM